MTKVYLLFYNLILPAFTKPSKIFQGKDCEHSWNQFCFRFEQRESWNTVNDSQLFIRIAVKSKMDRLLEEGNISERLYQHFFDAVRDLSKFCSVQIKKVTLSWQKLRARAFCQFFLDVIFFILQV